MDAELFDDLQYVKLCVKFVPGTLIEEVTSLAFRPKAEATLLIKTGESPEAAVRVIEGVSPEDLRFYLTLSLFSVRIVLQIVYVHQPS